MKLAEGKNTGLIPARTAEKGGVLPLRQRAKGPQLLCCGNGNAYMKNGYPEHEMYKNGLKMSVLYIRRMIFSMYGGGQMLYNIDSHMDKSVIVDRR